MPKSSTRLFTALVTLAAIVAFTGTVLAAPNDTPMPIESFKGNPSGPRVVQIGDSNAVAAGPYYELKANGTYNTSQNNVSGTSMKDHLGQVNTASQLNPNAIVIALVTNDARRDPWTLYDGWWARAFQLVRQDTPDCTVVVKPYLGKKAWDVRASWWNQLLPLIQQYNIKVYDWNAEVRANPSWVLIDDVHFTPAGNNAYAGALMRANGYCL